MRKTYVELFNRRRLKIIDKYGVAEVINMDEEQLKHCRLNRFDRKKIEDEIRKLRELL